jgi:hypothetical protein
MKKVIILCIMAFGLSLTKADAQYVRRKPGFSIGISIGNRPRRPTRELSGSDPSGPGVMAAM